MRKFMLDGCGGSENVLGSEKDLNPRVPPNRSSRPPLKVREGRGLREDHVDGDGVCHGEVQGSAAERNISVDQAISTHPDWLQNISV
jgi:hypothetical protein